jgi:WD40-like Beta Propeller Repeat
MGQVTLPQDVWDAVGRQTGGRSDPLSVELTTLSGQSAAGPIKASWVIAQATLKGSIYYNSYNSQLGNPAAGLAGGLGGLAGGLGGFGGIGGGVGGNNGSILRIRPGRTAELFAKQGSCTGCHSMSANGERLILMEPANAGGVAGGLFGGGGAGGGATDGQAYAITPDTMPNPMPARAAAATSFVGLTPDGKLYVSSTASLGVGPRGAGGQSALYETDTGMVVSGSGIPAQAMMPTFSPDGTLLTFSDGAQGGKAIVVMDFDIKTRKASKPRTVLKHNLLLGWPFILPDNRAVIFSVTSEGDFSGAGAGVMGAVGQGPASDLGLVDLQTMKLIWLAKTIGFKSEADLNSNKTYLPFGNADVHQHYYPTVSPVSAGGYFWIFFDTIRHYGNQGLRRQLWGAAIAVPAVTELSTGNYESDPSFPAFYLPGQELPVANHRAFTALDPCRADGASCETGVDCCTGFCTDGKCGKVDKRCSKTGEACKTKSDCCNPAEQCLGGFCDIMLF